MSSQFNKDFKTVRVADRLWQVFNRHTNEPVSPQYSSPDAARYFVHKSLKQEMEKNIETLLGGSDAITSLDDDSTFYSRLHISEPRNGTEEI